MRKRNKLLMIIVSLLLCLTLISSCFVSSIYAKYTKSAKADGTVVLEKFGITVKADVADRVKAQFGNDVDFGEDTMTVTIPGLKLKPGDEYMDAVRFTITGTAEVPVQVKISAKLAYTNNNMFKVSNAVGGFSSGTNYCQPVGFTFGGLFYDEVTDKYTDVIDNSYVSEPYVKGVVANVQAITIKQNIISGVYDKIEHVENVVGYSSESTSSVNPYVWKNFANGGDSIYFYPADTENLSETAKDAQKMNAFEFGFAWPYEWGETPEEIEINDRLGMYISNNIYSADANYTFALTYIIQIEQTAARSQ